MSSVRRGEQRAEGEAAISISAAQHHLSTELQTPTPGITPDWCRILFSLLACKTERERRSVHFIIIHLNSFPALKACWWLQGARCCESPGTREGLDEGHELT